MTREVKENVEFLNTNVKEQMRQNRLMQSALERQVSQNEKLRNFFKSNRHGDWDKKRTDEKYVLSSMNS